VSVLHGHLDYASPSWGAPARGSVPTVVWPVQSGRDCHNMCSLIVGPACRVYVSSHAMWPRQPAIVSNSIDIGLHQSTATANWGTRVSPDCNLVHCGE
jgi:hypothetical protein